MSSDVRNLEDGEGIFGCSVNLSGGWQDLGIFGCSVNLSGGWRDLDIFGCSVNLSGRWQDLDVFGRAKFGGWGDWVPSDAQSI
jgi:hypothetical protein